MSVYVPFERKQKGGILRNKKEKQESREREKQSKQTKQLIQEKQEEEKKRRRRRKCSKREINIQSYTSRPHTTLVDTAQNKRRMKRMDKPSLSEISPINNNSL